MVRAWQENITLNNDSNAFEALSLSGFAGFFAKDTPAAAMTSRANRAHRQLPGNKILFYEQ
jgi:hypothetical protein